MKPIIDICCGSRMFWFDKKNPHCVFMDNRELETKLCDGRKLTINPDLLADFRHIPQLDNSFSLVVFDPPHLRKAGKKSWLGQKYGTLSENWQDDIKKGFSEGMRILKTNGVLVFKWNEEQISLSDVMPLFSIKPLFGHRRGKTIFLVFMKIIDETITKEKTI